MTATSTTTTTLSPAEYERLDRFRWQVWAARWFNVAPCDPLAQRLAFACWLLFEGRLGESDRD